MPIASPRAPAIVVVDAEPIVARLLPRVLRTVSDAPILVVSDGVQALDLLATRPVRLVIIDEHLPGMSGPELVRAIRAGWPAVRTILIVGRTTAELAEHAQKSRCDAYIVKPFTREQLAQTVQAVLA